MAEKQANYEELLLVKSLGHLTDDEALEHIGTLIDLAGMRDDRDGLDAALALAKEMEHRQQSDSTRATLQYFIGNAWANIVQVEMDEVSFGGWESEGREKSILYYRRAMRDAGFTALTPERRCQILTNLGNQLSGIGRPIEAIEYWDQALTHVASFPMARGNRGQGLCHLARMVDNRAQMLLILRSAEPEIAATISSQIYPEARATFERYQTWLREMLATPDSTVTPMTEQEQLGDSDEERRYRRWCLNERLFLNPTNDLGALPSAAWDSLVTPSLVTPIGVGPRHVGVFNQLKQEFVSARYLLYESTRGGGSHFSDRRVVLYNTLDYPSYSLDTEKLRLAFRSAYSLLDKMTFFLNWYLGWQIPERGIYFKTCWYANQNRKAGPRSDLINRENWPLRGLFWLSKDLFEDRADFRDSMEPEAQSLYELRNQLEHKYLKLHDMWLNHSPGDPFHDALAHSLKRSDFEAKTLRLFKIVRAAMMYLVFAMRQEEADRENQRPAGGIIPPIWLDVYEDEWKS